MMREDAGTEAHFVVISFWNSRDAIHGYAGADISKVRPLPRDGEFLIEPEATVRNYDLVVNELQRQEPRGGGASGRLCETEQAHSC